jgi:hypothetical protein
MIYHPHEDLSTGLGLGTVRTVANRFRLSRMRDSKRDERVVSSRISIVL